MTVSDLFHIYALKHNTETAGMLNDYVLDVRLDRAALNDMILLELGDRIPYYNETTVLKFAIDNWFYTHKLNIKRLLDALETEYDFLNPLEIWEDNGFNEIETEHVDKDMDHITSFKDYKEKVTYASSDVNKYNSATTKSGETENKYGHDENTLISAYNSTGYQPQGKMEYRDSDKEIYHEITDRRDGDDTVDHKGHDDKSYEGTTTLQDVGTERSSDHVTGQEQDKHKWGRDTENIAELVEAEIKLARHNIYQWICDNLGEKICLGIF